MKGKIDGLSGKLRQNSNELSPEAVEGILRVLESIRLEDMPCSQVFALLDQYVERELKDHEAAKVMPLLREHFDTCADCCEEYEALLEAVERTTDDSGLNNPGASPS
jgi:hypothetical protein